MSSDTIIFRFPKEHVVSRSMIIVQPTEKAVVIFNGQVQAILEPGSQNLQTGQNALTSALSRFRYSQLPFDTVIFFVSMTRHEVKVTGTSQTEDLVPLVYEAAVYFRVNDPARLIFNVQFSSNFFRDQDLAVFISPMIDQEVSSILNHVKLNEVFKRFGDISTAVTAQLKPFLSEIGIELISVRIMSLLPQDQELRRIIQLRDMGIDLEQSVRLFLSRLLSEKNDPASVNMALGVPYYPNLHTVLNIPEGIIRLEWKRPEEKGGTTGQSGGQGGT